MGWYPCGCCSCQPGVCSDRRIAGHQYSVALTGVATGGCTLTGTGDQTVTLPDTSSPTDTDCINNALNVMTAAGGESDGGGGCQCVGLGQTFLVHVSITFKALSIEVQFTVNNTATPNVETHLFRKTYGSPIVCRNLSAETIPYVSSTSGDGCFGGDWSVATVKVSAV